MEDNMEYTCPYCGVDDELATQDDDGNIYCIHCKKKIEED